MFPTFHTVVGCTARVSGGLRSGAATLPLIAAERDELGPGSFVRGTTVAQGPAHSCLQLPFVWIEAVGLRGDDGG